MLIKLVELRDRGTCVPALALRMFASDDIQRRFFERCGYPSPHYCQGLTAVILMHLGDQRANSDPYGWDDRTMAVAHEYLLEHWDEVLDGGVLDVRVLLGETATSAPAEIL